MGGRRVDCRGTRLAAGRRRPHQRRAAGNHVVHDQRLAAGDIPHEGLAADLVPAAVFLHKAPPHGMLQHAGQTLAHPLRPLHSAGVRRHHGQRSVRKVRPGVLHQQRRQVQVDRANAKGVLEGRRIVHIHGHHRVRADGLEEGGGVAGVQRIPRLGPPVLAPVGQIRRHRRHPGRPGVLQRADEKQQAHQLLVRVQLRVTRQGGHHETVGRLHAHERPDLVLAVLELPHLVGRGLDTQALRHGRAQRFAAGENEQPQGPMAADHGRMPPHESGGPADSYSKTGGRSLDRAWTSRHAPY